MQLTEEWENVGVVDGVDKNGVYSKRNAPNVNWWICDEEGENCVAWLNGNWQMITTGTGENEKTYWYYKGMFDPEEEGDVYKRQVCDTEIFQYYFQLEKKRMERSGQRTWLALLALTAPDFCRLPPVKLREAVGQLDLVLRSSLRKGDIICRTHEAQFLLLLPNCNKSRSLRILARIEDRFRRSCTDPGLVLHKKVQPLAASSSRCV